MLEAPRAFNRHVYHQKNIVFYGTDDGYQDGSFGEFPEFVNHYNSVEPWRRENIHFVGVVGGLYTLNMLALWQPKRITIFDINPMAICYFKIIRRVWGSSENAADFLDRLTRGAYDVSDEDEEFVRENIMLKQAGNLPPSRGSTKRPYETSWKYALDNFDLTKRLLTEVPMDIRNEPMESESFAEMIRNQGNTWVYASNITEFHYFDLEINDPSNVVVLQIIFPGKPQLVDLAQYGKNPVRVNFQIPVKVERINS